MLRRFMSVAGLVFAASFSHAIDIRLLWDHDGADSGGRLIPPESLTYNLYVATDGDAPALLATTVANEYLWENADIGCHVFHVTAYRSDSDLESGPSNTVDKCVTTTTDGEIQLLIPRTPANLRSRWRFAQ